MVGVVDVATVKLFCTRERRKYSLHVKRNHSEVDSAPYALGYIACKEDVVSNSVHPGDATVRQLVCHWVWGSKTNYYKLPKVAFKIRSTIF